jgi:hypothetical protein
MSNLDVMMGMMELELTARFPRSSLMLRAAVKVTEQEARPFQQLPRDRELSFLPDEASRARVQKAERERLANFLAMQLVEKLLQLVESQDTVNGYAPEEWAAMNRKR